MKNNTRETQIENFCTDLRIIWSKEYPDLTFGDIVQILSVNHVNGFTKESEILDILMDLGEE